jgi:membrane protease YdiL (CAAX protease family)
VYGLQLANRLVELPAQRLPDFGAVPQSTVLALLLFGAPVAGIVEEAAFRGYMQGPIERRCGLFVAILITGTMFAVAHLDFTPVLWPYYVAVAAIYGVLTNLTGSILPAVVLHTAGNVYSNLDLWRHGRAEWQAPAGSSGTIWAHGPDAAFCNTGLGFGAATLAAIGAFVVLSRMVRPAPPPKKSVT